MPFKSAKQRRYMHAREPDIAQRWEGEAKQSGSPAIQASDITEGLPQHRKVRKKAKSAQK